jgi:DNA-binding winged helix-turn-helix (wHTH) protein/TolB-like protein
LPCAMKEVSSINTEIYEFADFRVDVGERVLERMDTRERISLPDKAFETLCHLVRNPNRLVSKSELLSHVWPDAFVEENNLNKSIHAIRRALGEKNGDQKFIETVKKHGYRFIAEVTQITNPLEDPRIEMPLRDLSTSGSATHARSEDPVKKSYSPNAAEVSAQSEAADQRNRRFSLRLPIAAALLLVIVISGVYIYRNAASPAFVPASTLPSLAVLPLRPVVPETRDRSVELAVADSLIHKLSESDAFRVRDLSAIRTFVDRTEDAVTLGHELDTDYVIASTYQFAGTRIRVTSQLVNANNGVTEQTFRSESDAQDIFAMQDLVANEIGNAVLARFGKTQSTFASKRGTLNEEAFNLFYEAQYLVDKNTKDDSAKAAEILGQALDVDPNFAQAWALRAQAYCQFAHNGGGDPTNVFSIAEPFLEKALTLDADNQVAYSVRGLINRDYHWDFPAAYRDFDRAIKENPQSLYPHRYLAGLYYQDGRFAEAVAEQRKAVAINPTSVIDRCLLGKFLLGANQSDEGLRELQRVKTMAPAFGPSYFFLWAFYDRKGDGALAYENFVKYKEIDGADKHMLAKYGDAFRRAGWPAVMRTEFDLAVSSNPKGQYSGREFYIATIGAIVGEKDIAFDYLELALQYRLIGMAQLKVDRKLDSLRDDPRFHDILRRAGFGNELMK